MANDDARVREQVEYYRERAPEYDDWFYQRGRKHTRGDHGQERTLADGRTFEIVKVYYTADEVADLFTAHGFHAEVTATPTLWIAVARLDGSESGACHPPP